MRVLIADKFEEHGVRSLQQAGCAVTLKSGLNGEALRLAVVETQCAVLVVRSTAVTRPVIEASESLGLIVRAGAGTNTIDVDAASQCSIFVANCPGKNAVAVAELTFALMLALDRRVVENTLDLRQGRWNKKLYSQARGLLGRTLAVLGTGPIGRAVIQRAHAFGMPVVAWSRSLDEATADELRVRRAASARDAAACADILSVHVAAAPETRHLISRELLSAMKPGSMLINTARAEVVDYAALAEAVAEKGLRVGLDVFPDEPAGGTADFHAEILRTGGIVYGTHHIGASTDQAQDAIAEEVVRIVRVYQDTGQVLHCVNRCERSPARFMLVLRHRNRPGVLAHTLHAISRAGVNVEEMENVIYRGAEGACAHIRLAGALDESILEQIRQGHEHVISAVQLSLPT